MNSLKFSYCLHHTSTGQCCARWQLNELLRASLESSRGPLSSCSKKTLPRVFPALENTAHTKQHETSNKHRKWLEGKSFMFPKIQLVLWILARKPEMITIWGCLGGYDYLVTGEKPQIVTMWDFLGAWNCSWKVFLCMLLLRQ